MEKLKGRNYAEDVITTGRKELTQYLSEHKDAQLNVSCQTKIGKDKIDVMIIDIPGNRKVIVDSKYIMNNYVENGLLKLTFR